MSRKKIIFIVILSCIVLACTAWYLSKYYDPHETEIHVGYKGEALMNRFLALQRLLEKNHFPTERSSKLSAKFYKNYSKHALFMPLSAIPSKDKHFQRLQKWVNDGGTLITGISVKDDLTIRLKDKRYQSLLGIKNVKLIKPQAEKEEEEKEKKDDLDKIKEKIFKFEDDGFSGVEQEFKFPTNEETIKINTRELSLNFLREPEIVIRGKQKGVLSYISTSQNGEGEIIFVSDIEAFTNDHLINQDNPAYIFRLLTNKNNFRSYYVIYGFSYPSLMEFILDNAFPVLFTLLLTVLLFIYKVSQRFGPIDKAYSVTEKFSAFSTHFEASGAYRLSALGELPYKLKIKNNCLKSLLFKNPQWSRLKQNNLHKAIEKKADLSTDEAEIFANAGNNSNFIEYVKLIQKIRKACYE